jgi:acetylornithine/succinyldiaminopimelate/putrescine aminotransferase/predicted amino acid dehydrogenase
MLSERLYRETGRRFVVCLASTGTEAVELALKHALFARRERFTALQDRLRRAFGPTHPVETDACLAHNSAAFAARRPVLIALRGGFHGLTGGALHALGSDHRRRPFAELLGLRTVFLSPTADAESLDQLDRTLAAERLELQTLRPGDSGVVTESISQPDVLAVCAEPILGEGGIVEVPREWLLRFKVPGVPLIMDEIQTGLGRTGAFLASSGVTADYYLFGKALGGGVAKVSAVAIDRQRYCPAFDEMRASTFSDDAFSAEVGKAVLTVIDGDDLVTSAATAGQQLRAALCAVQNEFPGVVRSVRGRGLMLGIELGLPPDAAFPLFRALGQDRLGYLGSSFLLNRHRVRALPTLSAPNVFRLEPSAYLSASEIDHAVTGLRALCRALAAGDVFELTRHLVARDEPAPAPYLGVSPFRQSAAPPPPGAARVGFVFPSVYPDGELLASVPAYRALNPGQRCELVRRFHLILDGQPIVQYTRALFGGRVWLAGIFVPLLPEELERARATGATGRVRDRVEEAVRVAAGLGCRTVVLGGQTSSVSADGTAVRAPDGVRLSTGNTFTVAVAARQLADACREAGITGSSPTDRIAVVGAAGNIGSALARVLAGTAPGRRLLLVGRPGSEDRLAVAAAAVRATAPAADVAVSTRLADVVGCNVVVVALSGSQPVLLPEHVAPDRPVVVVDVSQPRAVSSRIRHARPRALVRAVGFVRLPQDGDFRASPFTPPGVAFACLAEAVLVGLGATAHRLTGTIEPAAVESLAWSAEQFGLLPSADVE